MITGFLLVFSIWKNKTFITSKILLILTGYKLKKPHDYAIGVFIGYAENDFIFPCFILTKFIEEELHLTTYIYNRDNIPNRDRASSIVDAINASWRIILVVTDNFLCNDDWAMFTTRTAIYGLSPVTPSCGVSSRKSTASTSPRDSMFSSRGEHFCVGIMGEQL